MFKLMQRYLAVTFVPPFMMGTVFFVSFLLTFQLFRIIRLLSNKSVSLTVLFELIGHIAVSFIPIAVPVAALFATIFTLTKLSDDSEIVAMRSFGVTKIKIVSPFLFVGIIIAVAVFSLNQTTIPSSKARFKEIIMRLTSKGFLSDITPENFYSEIPGIILFAENVHDNGDVMINLFINQKMSTGERTILAKRGALIKQTFGKWSTPTVRLHLNDGNIVNYNNDGTIEKIIFEEYDFPIMSSNSKMDLVTKDSMRSSSDLLKYIRKSETRLNKLKADHKNNPGAIKAELRDLAKSKIEYWSRVNTPIQSLIFIFLGVTLGVKKRRGKAQNTAAIGMLVLFSYYLVFFMGMTLAKKGVLPAGMVVFIPTAIVLIAAGYLYKKLDWAS